MTNEESSREKGTTGTQGTKGIGSSDPRKNGVQSKIKKYLLPAVVFLLAVAIGAAFSWYGEKLCRFGLWGAYGTRIFYDQFHVRRHFIDGENKRGEWEYHIVSGYHDFREALEKEGFEFYVHKEGRLEPGMLDNYDIFFIGEQTKQGTPMEKDEREVIFDFIKRGGSMWCTAEHTNAHNMSEYFNDFMKDTGVKARFDSICEDNGTTESRDWVTLDVLKKHPITQGLEEVYYFNGCSLDTKHAVIYSSKETWSDAWNPKDKPVHNGNNVYDPGELKGPLPAFAALSYGDGRIAVTCDHNPLSNPTIKMGSNSQLAVNAMKWLGGSRVNNAVYYLGAAVVMIALLVLAARRFRVARIRTVSVFLAAGALFIIGAIEYRRNADKEYEILFAEINNPSVSARNKDPEGLWSFFEHMLKTDKVSLWLKKKILPGYDALAIVAPREKLSDEQLAQMGGYLKEGKTVIYMATKASLDSNAGRQLMDRFGFKVTMVAQPQGGARARKFDLTGLERMRRGVSFIAVDRDVPMIKLEGSGWRVVAKAESGDDSIDLISIKKEGAGRVIVLSPVDLFMGKMKAFYKEPLNFVDLSMNFAEWIKEES